MRVVVDASAVLTLLLEPGSRGDEVAGMLADAELHAPDHLPVEVANVVHRRRNASLLSEAESRLALDGFWALPLHLWPFEKLSERAWQLGANLSSYDAAYVALAEQLEVDLVTGDVRLSRAPGIACSIRLV
ncbi:MAG: type II toxin-antitoxin system VapC family toxin [Pseudolysinimonas sp.]|uniref:type II toxin-antitoxin system VapC family toxin n=1 Tax=Pseudolysinimonas sp. TaxID=2680009 RepID=UPI003264452C